MIAGMAERLPQLLRTHHAALKTAWLRRLRVRPPVSAMARVEILAHYMDDSLRQLVRLLGGNERRRLPSVEPLTAIFQPSHCPCGLNPLLDYYATGAEALGGVLSDLTNAEREQLSRCWHQLGQGEIEALCNVCCRRSAACPTVAATVTG